MCEPFFVEREYDERLLIALLVLDRGQERATALKYLRPHHFTLRYADWMNAIAALHTQAGAIDSVLLIKQLEAAGVHEPEEELRLIYAEMDGSYEPLEQVAQRVIQNYRLRYFVNLMQAALKHGRKGHLTAFDESVRSARRLAHEMTSGAPVCPPVDPVLTAKKAPVGDVSVNRRRSRFSTSARQPS